MENFADFLAGIDNPEHRARTEEVLKWVAEKHPGLGTRIGWNQPMFTDHGTFIIAFSVTKKHLAVAPEKAGINHFSADIVKAGYEHSNDLFRIPWDRPVDYSLLAKMIDYNIEEKVDCTTFWRK